MLGLAAVATVVGVVALNRYTLAAAAFLPVCAPAQAAYRRAASIDPPITTFAFMVGLRIFADPRCFAGRLSAGCNGGLRLIRAGNN